MVKNLELKKINTEFKKNLNRTKYIENSLVYFTLISLFCVNFMGRGSIVCLIFGLLAFFEIRDFKLDICTFFCFLLSLSAIIASIIYAELIEAIKCINFLLMYLIGLNGYFKAHNKELYIKRLVFSIFLGYAIYIFLTFVTNRNIQPEYEGQRVIINFWTKERMSVTLVGLVSSVIIGYVAYVFLCRKKLLLKILALASLALVVSINSKTATRTPILMIPIIAVIMGVIYIFNQNGLKALRIIAIGLLLLALAILLIDIDFMGVRTAIESTPVFKRFQKEGEKTSRVEILKVHFAYFFDYMWGGGHIETITGRMAHNYLQQGHDLYGFFASIALVFITICVLINIVKLLKKRNKKESDYLFLSMYIVIMIQLCLEPVFTGYPCYFFSFLLIHGTATGYLNSSDIDRMGIAENENC